MRRGERERDLRNKRERERMERGFPRREREREELRPAGKFVATNGPETHITRNDCGRVPTTGTEEPFVCGKMEQ